MPPGKLCTSIEKFRDAGGKGLNITLPFKREASELCTSRSDAAKQAKAVNTIWFNERGEICGDNTDGIGLLRDLRQNLGMNLQGMRILILGAGGAISGIMDSLISCTPKQILIANRTVEKAAALIRDHRHGDIEFGHLSLAALQGIHDSFDLIINGTTLGLGNNDMPELPDRLLATGGYCYDLVYADTPTVFVRWGLQQNATISCDGLGMLVEQAAESFYLWRGVRPPDTQMVLDTLRKGSSVKDSDC